MKVNLPLVDQAYYTPGDATGHKSVASTVRSKFAGEIAFASSLTKVPEKMILAIILAESTGKADSVAKSGAVGLMQVKPQTANDVIFLEFKKKRLSIDELKYLADKLGNRLPGITKMQYLSHKLPENQNKANVITKEDLLDPKFNVFVGSLLIGLLLDQETTKAGIRVDKSLYRYNQGYFSKPIGNTPSETLAWAKKKSQEAYNYIVKIAGRNGLLHTLATT
jgi:hypothetical protein